ncbi:sn-1-specific diacylglycerol lipase ABHD11-like [Petaurus breviceps papuanus]|uniref:sn-1-specific diacylglycerol lipase ABHD11-like n=1 Tax=Petaurus breviceps papuanus TaxID=3040969 RepID=UPI0036DE3AB8
MHKEMQNEERQPPSESDSGGNNQEKGVDTQHVAVGSKALGILMPLAITHPRLLDGQDTLPPVVFLHGLFSNKSIFQAQAEALAQQTGRKPELVEHLVAVDVSPLVTPEIPKIFKTVPVLNSINLLGNLSGSQASEVVDEYLKLFVEDSSHRQYLFNSLVQINGQYVWKANAEILWQKQNQFLDTLAVQGVYRGPTLFLRGSDSCFLPPSHYPKIKLLFPEVQFQSIPDAGHIIHIKKPQEFMSSILSFLS